MSLFRAAAKVTTPDGHEWEIYAYKLSLRDRDDPQELLPPVGGARAEAVWAVVDALFWLVLLVPRLLLRLVDTARAAVAAARSDEWTIEAVTFLPQPTSYTWTTTSEYKGQVLAQVEGHLARGAVPHHLTNAVYRGERRSAR